MTETQFRTIEGFFRLINLPVQTAALNAALRLGVVDALAEGQKSPQQLAKQCKLNLRGLEALLLVLQDTGLIEKFENDYALSQAARMVSKTVWRSIFNHWTLLEDALRQSSSELAEGNGSGPRVPPLNEFKALLAQIEWAATGAALKAADALGIGSERKNLRILDLGCGAAIYSMTLAHRDPTSRVTLVDDAADLGRAKTTIASLDAQSRVDIIESADLLLDGMDSSFDLAIIADRVNLLSESMLKSAINEAMRVLIPGGELVIVDAFPGQANGTKSMGICELQFIVGTGRNIWTPEQLTTYLTDLGFEQIQFTHLPAPPLTRGLILAAKPL